MAVSRVYQAPWVPQLATRLVAPTLVCCNSVALLQAPPGHCHLACSSSREIVAAGSNLLFELATQLRRPLYF